MLETTVAVSKSSEIQNLHRVQLKSFLKSLGGKFVSLEFVKLDGSVRKLTGRFGVKAHLAGGENLVEAEDRPYLTVFDTVAKGYRTINLATVKNVRACNRTFAIVG